MKFKIPATAVAADKLSIKLGEEATAREWKRAAMVYARVRVQAEQGRPSDEEKVKSDLLSPAEYAALGIHGLCSKNTVRRYWQAWSNAITEGLAEPVSLGDEVELPDAEWADYYSPAPVETPPYFVPSGNKDPIPTGDVNEWDAANSFSQQSRRASTMPQGDCPPIASDVDKPEGQPLGPNGWGPEDGRDPRGGFPDAVETDYRPRAPLPDLDDDEDEDFDADYFNETIFNLYLDSLKNYAENIFKTIDGVTFRGDADKTLEVIEKVRETLTEIENAVNHSKENGA